jgi:K+-sensing histidine kinase KdpD
VNNKKILIAIDDSETTEQVVAYVGEMIEGAQDVQVLLMHMPTPLPPILLEFGESEDAEQERHLEARLAAAQTDWIEKIHSAAEPVFAKAYAILQMFDIPEQALATQVVTPRPEEDLTTSILEAARSHACGTVVVGRASFPWLREVWEQHVADRLLQEGQGLTVWVVQSDTASAA